jgi:hypothetical protein
MANWEPRITAGATLTEWTDSTNRIQPLDDHPPRYYLAVVGAAVTIQCALLSDGVVHADADLGGLLYTAHFAEHATPYQPAIMHAAGHSETWSFTPPSAGHYTLVIRRDQCGACVIHLDAA